MDGAMLARLGAVGFVVLAIAVATFGPSEEAPEPVTERFASPAVDQPDNPLRRELARCQALGEAGPRDARCLGAWAQSRSRFLTGTKATEAP